MIFLNNLLAFIIINFTVSNINIFNYATYVLGANKYLKLQKEYSFNGKNLDTDTITPDNLNMDRCTGLYII